MHIIRRSTALAVAAAVLLGLAATGCKPPPKPTELTELERILGEEGANQVKEYPGAGQYYRDARNLREVAIEKYDERELEKATHYAIRGKIAYRTAQAIAQQVKANKRLKEANAKIKSVNPEIKRLEAERDKLQRQTGELAREIRSLQNEQQVAERRQELQAAQQDAEDDAQELRSKAQQALQDAVEARRKAQDVKADRFAEASYNRANNQLKSAQALMDSAPNSAEEVLDSAKAASETFEKAVKEAQPAYKEYLAKQDPQERVASLTEKLKFNFGDEAAESAPRGVRAILAGLFDEGESRLSARAESELETVAKLAKQFDEFRLQVHGYTQTGNATENLSVSQVRAKRVKDYLVGQGISEDRLESEGKGQGRIRYPDQPSKNDRVEIIFRLPVN